MGAAQLDPVLVGQVIARFRREKGLTQEVLSGLSDIGRTQPTLETLFRISGALGVPMSIIVAEIEKEAGS